MARIEPDTNPAAVRRTPLLRTAAVLPAAGDEDFETPALPREHPPWARDAAAVSTRARRLLEQLRPIVVRVLSFWDHHARAVLVGGGRLSIDASGSYRFD